MVDNEGEREQSDAVTSPFDAIRHMDGEREFWLAREISKILGYNRWENFENVMVKAKTICEQSHQAVSKHFLLTKKVVCIGKRSQREIIDYQCTRYALHLLLLSSDIKKKEILYCLSCFALIDLKDKKNYFSLAKNLGVATPNTMIITKEQATIGQIVKAFKHITSFQQYRVLSYVVDLYFPQYRIAVECDEHDHQRYDKDAERKRQKLIERTLQCTFVRYNPDAVNFNVGDVIHQIMMLIYNR